VVHSQLAQQRQRLDHPLPVHGLQPGRQAPHGRRRVNNGLHDNTTEKIGSIRH
jgi:hypothetical protein